MAPIPPPAPGNPAGGPPAPPCPLPEPDHISLARRIAALRLVRTAPPYLRATWDALRYLHIPDDDAPAAVIEPATLARLEPIESRRALAALTPTQQVAQAVAQAAWLASFGYNVNHEEILALWASTLYRTAA